MSCEFAQHDGAYVLGALPTAERVRFEQHLAGCGDCARAVRELAGLPGLLARLDATVLDATVLDAEETPAVPDTLLPGLVREVRRRTRRRAWFVTAAAAAAAVAVAAVPVGVSQIVDEDRGTSVAVSPTPAGEPTPRPMTAVGGPVPVTAEIALESVPWGTRLDLTCRYDPARVPFDLPPAVSYALFVKTRAGREEQVGTWRSVRGRTLRLIAATATPQRDIAAVEVRTLEGRTVLQLTT